MTNDAPVRVNWRASVDTGDIMSQRLGMRSTIGNAKMFSSETLGIEFLYPLVGICRSFSDFHVGVSNGTSHLRTLM